MAGQLKLRRGTTSQLANYIGSEGELTYDTALKSLVLHDGVTLGGVKIPYLSNGLVPSTMLPTATESVVGASKIATTAIAQAGVNDTDFITALKLKNTLDAKAGFAQINANGTINRSKGIIQSCTKTATGTYAVNILNPLNKGVFALTASNGASFAAVVSYVSSTSLQITTQNTNNSGFADKAFTIGVELQ